MDIVLAPDGTLVVADSGNHCIRTIRNGLVQTLAGVGQPGYADGPAAQAMFFLPVGVALTADGTVFVADGGNQLVRAISKGSVSTVAGHIPP